MIAASLGEFLAWSVPVLAIAIVLSACYSGTETGIYAVNRLRVELRGQRGGDQRAVRLLRLLDSRELVLCVLLLGNNLANELAAILAERIAGNALATSGASGASPLVSTLLLTPVLFIVGEALPKHVFRLHAETLTYRVVPFLRVSGWLLWPFARVVLPLARWANRWAAGRQDALRGLRHDEYALEHLLVAGGSHIEPVRGAVLRVRRSGQLPVTRFMVPLAEAQWVPAAAGLGELRAKLRASRHTRYPLRDADGGFRSYIHFLDPFLEPEKGPTLAAHARPLVVVDARLQLAASLDKLEREGGRVGVVRDAVGATLGFVLAGDLVAGLLAMDNPARRKGSRRWKKR